MSRWEQAITWEALWWGAGPSERWDEERQKQRWYAAAMGMPKNMDFGGLRIADFGCGPVSMLLSSKHGPSIGIDPLPVVKQREDAFRQRGARVFKYKAEDADIRGYDEAWMYNVLQHVDDPDRVLARVAAAAPVVRLFEWIDTGIGDGHIHSVSERQVAAAFTGWFQSARPARGATRA